MASLVGPLAAVALLAVSGPVSAQPDPGDSGGECAGGLCGEPEMTGGGGCGCGGGSILINNTDIGDTYQYADDYDSDGFEDNFDNCPFALNPEQIDSDGDGVGDVCDNCVSAANGLQNNRWTDTTQVDTDRDGIGDACDPDIDNDGFLNGDDVCPLVPGSQIDTDDDGLGNACDTDDDNDTIPDADDDCPLVHRDEPDPDAACDTDEDGDNVFDSIDNCLTIPNFDQADMDDDKVGDACDLDRDGDDYPDLVDNCPAVENGADQGAAQLDSDRDGVGDACDSRFCYVVSPLPGVREPVSTSEFDPAVHCLDPVTDPFTVLSLPYAVGAVGEPSQLHLFSNLENTAIRYTWRVIDRPDGSRARIENFEGSVAVSEAFEYRYLANRRAQFTPDVAGDYEIEVTASLVLPDPRPGFTNPASPNDGRVSVYSFTLEAEEGDGGGGGCTNVRGDISLIALALFAAAGFWLRRRRRA